MLYAREFPSVKWPCLPELKLKQDELCFSRRGAWPAALCLSGDQWHWNGTTAEAQSIGCVLYCDPAGELVITLCVCVYVCVCVSLRKWQPLRKQSLSFMLRPVVCCEMNREARLQCCESVWVIWACECVDYGKCCIKLLFKNTLRGKIREFSWLHEWPWATESQQALKALAFCTN